MERKDWSEPNIDTVVQPERDPALYVNRPKKVSNKTLISFESGHYKEVTGHWKGDSIWAHFVKDSGGELHVNKDKVEYTETF